MSFAMPRYFFNLKDSQGITRDMEGMELPDENSARYYACGVARELMRNRERHTRSWRIATCDTNGALCFELLFASVDPSLSYLPPQTRASVEDVCQKTASLSDAVNQVRRTMVQVRGTMARSRGAPYVIAVDGARL